MDSQKQPYARPDLPAIAALRRSGRVVQAARSGLSNIVEGNKQQSLEGYIKLTGVARGSLEELLKDYLGFARQRKLEIWEKERVIREMGEIRVIWEILRKTPILPDTPNFPNLPSDSEKVVNTLITLINQANYLLDRLVVSLKNKHMREGGMRENLLKRRLSYRNTH
jgi:four helix bundle suffix protein